MKRGEKSEGGVAEKKENLVVKVRKRVLVGKRAGPSTPSPVWRLGPAQDSIIVNKGPPIFSARRLAATLWEIHHFLPLAKMRRGGGGGGGGPPPPLPPNLRHRHKRDKGHDLPTSLVDPFPISPDQPGSAGSLRRYVATAFMQHHRANERNERALQPLSPASYDSSIEVGHYNPALTPTSSIDFKGRIGESSYSLKTSTDLLKVLNRIWSLEEQQASNVSLIKALKMELGHARARIKKLLRDQRAERHEIDDLMKQVEDKLIRKSSKEQDRVNSAVQSARDELENERRLRKHSESLHRRLARELSELKSSFSNAMKELERERRSRELLEDLCDEFAKGIIEYQKEVHALKQKSDCNWAGRADHDRLILHLSESWLDERMQTKLLDTQLGSTEDNPILDRLNFEIETFLQAKRMHTSNSDSNMLSRDPTKERYLHRSSLEPIPLHEAVSGPRDTGDKEEASAGSDTNCFELSKPITSDFKDHGDEPEAHTERTTKSTNHTKKKPAPHERIKGRNPSNLQVKFEEQMARAMACNENKTSQVMHTDQLKQNSQGQGLPSEANISPNPENCEDREDILSYKRNIKQNTIILEPELNYEIDSLVRSQHLSSGSGKIHAEIEEDCREASFGNSAWRSHASPVREWMVKPASPDLDIPESSSKMLPKENTLKAKLLEARVKGKRSRLKAKITKGSM